MAANVNAMDEQLAQYRNAQKQIYTTNHRNALIKKVVGATLVAGTAAALVADFYFNNGENTKNYIIEPIKNIASKITTSQVGRWFSSAASQVGGWLKRNNDFIVMSTIIGTSIFVTKLEHQRNGRARN